MVNLMVKQRLITKIESSKEMFSKELLSGRSPEKLALSFAIGIYISFSPFPGLHTVMMFIFKYLFDLHFPTLFLATSINNPWTMIPFFTFDYFFGYWLVHHWLALDPSWQISLVKIFGTGSICVWSFLIGGNVLGILGGLLSYPVIFFILKFLMKSNTTQ